MIFADSRCLKTCKIDWKAPVMESFFNPEFLYKKHPDQFYFWILLRDHLSALHTVCKLNVRETFRRRLRCHLNVICTFNLLLVFKKPGCFQIYANYYKLFKIIFLKRCKWNKFRKLSDFAFFHLFTFDFTQLADELNELLGSKWELRNAEQTLELIRLMVKIETLHERQELLKILQTTSDSSALKAFVRYKGLALLWSWMVDAPEEKMKYKREVWLMFFIRRFCEQSEAATGGVL